VISLFVSEGFALPKMPMPDVLLNVNLQLSMATEELYTLTRPYSLVYWYPPPYRKSQL